MWKFSRKSSLLWENLSWRLGSFVIVNKRRLWRRSELNLKLSFFETNFVTSSELIKLWSVFFCVEKWSHYNKMQHSGLLYYQRSQWLSFSPSTARRKKECRIAGYCLRRETFKNLVHFDWLSRMTLMKLDWFPKSNVQFNFVRLPNSSEPSRMVKFDWVRLPKNTRLSPVVFVSHLSTARELHLLAHLWC